MAVACCTSMELVPPWSMPPGRLPSAPGATIRLLGSDLHLWGIDCFEKARVFLLQSSQNVA